MVSRRAIMVTGGVSAVVVGAGLVPLLHSDLTKARAPWTQAGTGFGDPRLDALSWAVLAPSAHNRQPWLARLDGEDALTLFCDLERRLPETDPPDRQTTIGLGAFLELMRMAAAAQGYRLDVSAFPEGEPYPRLDGRAVARVVFVPDTDDRGDPLFAAVAARRTSRGAFDPARPVTAETLNGLDAVLRAGDGEFEWVNDDANVGALKTLCREAWRTEMEAPGPRRETAALTRIGERAINANPDGVSLYGPAMEAMGAAGLLTQKTLDDPSSAAWRGSIDFYNRNIDTAMAFGWLSTTRNARTDQLRAGAGWVRLQLAAAAAGLSMQPFSQALQEFPEMAELFEALHDFTGVRAPAGPLDGRIQGLFRFGYGAAAPASPRWPLTTRLVGADA